jgi:TonB family protein
MGKLKSIGAATLALMFVGAAPKSVPTQPPSRWVEAPSRAAFVEALPDATRAARRYGDAMMRCVAQADGTLADCRLLRDTPPNAGYGQTLLKLAPKYRLRSPAPGKSVVVEEEWMPFDTPPDWLKRPRPEDILGVYPREALRKGQNGMAVISCIVTTQGALSNCVVIAEDPEGLDFGAAALALTPQLLMKPAVLSGQPVTSTAQIPIRWSRMAGAVAPPTSRGLASPAMVWDEAPGYVDVAGVYPKKAAASKIGGRATVACNFDATGRLANCNVIAEEPKGQGFGTAAKALSKQFRTFTQTADGKGVKDIGIHLPVVFDVAMIGAVRPVVGQPRWAALPSREEMAGTFGALKLEGTLRTTLSCTVAAKGALGDCRVMSETPEGKGVGAAALTLTPKFRLTTWTAEGLPTIGGSVQIPIRYEP